VGVGADTDIQTVEDLEGQLFNPSTIGGGGEYITEQVFNVLGIQPDYQRMRLSDAAEAVVDGRIVGLSYNAIPPNPSFTEVHSNRPLRLLEISDEQFAAVSAELPFLAQTVVPADTYTGMPDTQTIGIFMSVGANADLPEDVAYEMTKAFWENHEEVASAFPAAQGVTPEVAVAEATYPLHAGAARYYQELGIEIPDDVMPPEM
jgi:TRAP transporter TAXI family solute receptor